MFACQDGWITITTGTDAQWASMCAALEQHDLANDERFKTAAARSRNVEAWYDAMERSVQPFPIAEVVKRLRAADVPVAPVLDPTEVAADAQVIAREMIQEIEHPVAGRLRQPRPSAAWFGAELELAPAPLHGEHTTEILGELAYDPDNITQLHADGVVGKQPPSKS